MILARFGFSRHIFIRVLNVKVHRNPSNGRVADTSGRMTWRKKQALSVTVLMSLQNKNTRTIAVQTESVNLPLFPWLLNNNKLLDNHNYRTVVEYVVTQHLHKITDSWIDGIFLLNSYFFVTVSLSSGKNLSLNIGMFQLLHYSVSQFYTFTHFACIILVTATKIISASLLCSVRGSMFERS